ncbi:uncharacterized protein METZ01_LOCUS307770, partial [marine metagenome]
MCDLPVQDKGKKPWPINRCHLRYYRINEYEDDHSFVDIIYKPYFTGPE